MQELLEFLEYLSKLFPLFVVIAGFLAFYFREKIKQVLSRSLLGDIEKLRSNLAKDLANHSAKLQQDVESYKVTLIAEAERIKATQEVKKSLALKIAEKKFTSIAALLDAHLGLDTDIAALVAGFPIVDDDHSKKYFLDKKGVLLERLGVYSAAASASMLFISIELRQRVLAVRQAMGKVITMRNTSADPAVAHDNPDMVQLLAESALLEKELSALLEQMESFG